MPGEINLFGNLLRTGVIDDNELPTLLINRAVAYESIRGCVEDNQGADCAYRQ